MATSDSDYSYGGYSYGDYGDDGDYGDYGDYYGYHDYGNSNSSNTTQSAFYKDFMDYFNSPNSTWNDDSFQQEKSIERIKFYLLAFVIPPGLLFNLLSCTIFLREKMRKSATAFYFFALACADNIVLLGELLKWIGDHTSLTGHTFVDDYDSVCKFVYFLRYFGRMFSSWLVVTICIERFITVAYPLKRAWASTPRKAQGIIVGLAIACIIVTCPAFFTVGTHGGRSNCTVLDDQQFAYKYWIIFVIIGGEMIIPSVIVVIFTCLIIAKLKKARLRRMMSIEGQGKRSKTRKDMQPTIALLAVSIAFVTLRAPYIIIYPLHLNYDKHFSHHTDQQWLKFRWAFELSFVFAVVNYTVNFLLYIVTGKKFRGEFLRLILCKKPSRRGTWSTQSTRSMSISSQSTMLRRCSNGEILRDKNLTLETTSCMPDEQSTIIGKCSTLNEDTQL